MPSSDILNPEQRKAILATEGPLLVLAGAGAGKTRVIAHRILEIVRKGVAPEQILAITFTNKAAAEMRERVTELLRTSLGTPTTVPFVSTFHSLGLTIIKENRAALGLKRTPAIYDRNDSLREIKRAMKTLGIEDIEPRAVLGAISRQKGDGIGLAQFREQASDFGARRTLALWEKYEAALREDHAFDFDDLLLRSVELLRTNVAVREHYQGRWRYVHIDEYQDTNVVQALLTELLLSSEKNLCVVGDADQTIYGWRGARIRNILTFEKTFPGAQCVVLEENYRSTQTILAAANEVISKNSERLEKNLFTKNPEGAPISLYIAFDETDEAAFVTRTIGEAIRGGAQPKDFAVLYRANFQSRAIEEQLLHANIPYQVLGTRFFERKEVKDALSLLRAALYETPADIERVSNVPPRGIGKVTLMKVLLKQDEQLRGVIAGKVAAFRTMLARVAKEARELPASRALEYAIRESGLEQMLKEDKLEGGERLLNLKELIVLAARHDHLPPGESVEAFLEAAALASDQDSLEEKKNSVRLMTVHAAKGLEFKTVFITGLEDGLFPMARDGEGEDSREEERRLMYVALTRAQKKVYLSYASYRTVFGQKNATLFSPFLQDIPGELIHNEAPERLTRTIYLD